MRYGKGLLTLAAYLLTATAHGSDFGVHLQEVTVDYGRYMDGSRAPIVDNVKERLDLSVNLSLLKYLYLDNTVHSLTDPYQFRLVGWHYQFGVHFGRNIDVYYEHFSQHILDNYYDNYPLENLVGVKIKLYERQ